MPDFNYEQDLQINKHALDTELLEQAQKMFRYSSAHAQAMLNRDKAKQALDITKANLDSSIRAELTAAGTKFTEAVVDGRIRTSPTFIEAQERYQKTEHEVQVLLGAVMAMNARRSMLENLVRLFLGQYWSEPRVQGMDTSAGASINASEEAIMRGIPKSEQQPDGLPNPARPPTTRMVQDQVPSPLMYAIQVSDDPTAACSHGPFLDLDMALEITGSQGEVIVEFHRIDTTHYKVIRWWDQTTGQWSEKQPAITMVPKPMTQTLPEVKSVPPCPPVRPPAPSPGPARTPGPTPVPRRQQ